VVSTELSQIVFIIQGEIGRTCEVLLVDWILSLNMFRSSSILSLISLGRYSWLSYLVMVKQIMWQ